MAFLEFKNVRISGISAGVPKHVEYNQDYPYFEEGEAEKYIASTSVRERRIADPGVCSSDLCLSAAERLIKDLGWDKSEIECLLFVSQTADYILPATACILQERLGLPELLRHGYILGLLGLGLWFERDHFPAVLRADKEGLASFRGDLPFAILTVG